MKTISILKEWLPGERRVILLPQQVRHFVENGFLVYVEDKAGEGLGVRNYEYEEAGAKILCREDAWAASCFILKYKPPIEDEYKFLHEEMVLGAIFHAEGNYSLINVLLERKITAYSYEFFKTRDGKFPLSMVGGDIAGKMAVIYSAFFLQSHLGGSGTLLPYTIHNDASKVLIIGYGNVGAAAAKLAADMGAEVFVTGRNEEGLSTAEIKFS